MKTLHSFFSTAALCAAIASLPLTTQAAIDWSDASAENISTAETFIGTGSAAAGKVVTILSGGSLTITNGSTLTLDGNAQIVVQNGGSLILEDGYLEFSPQASVVFQSHLTISGNADNGNTLGGTLSFDGTITNNTSLGQLPDLFISGSTLKMTLLSDVESSSLSVLANLVITGSSYKLTVSGLTIGDEYAGAVTLTSQVGTLQVNGALIIKDYYFGYNPSTLTIAAGQLTANSTITNNGALNLFNDGRLNVNNTLNNSGNIYLYTSNALNIDGQLNNSGNITVNDGSISVNGGTLKNTNPGTITFDGETFDLSTATLNNEKSISITRGELLLPPTNAVNTGTLELSGSSTVSGRLSSGMLVKRTATDTTLFFSGVHDWTSTLQSQYVKPGGKTTLNLRAGQDYLYISYSIQNLTVPASHTLTIANGGTLANAAMGFQVLRFFEGGTINNNGLLSLTGGLTDDNLAGWAQKGFVRTPSPANNNSTLITLYHDDPYFVNTFPWSQHLQTEWENTSDTLVVSDNTNLSFASGTLHLTIPTQKALRLNGSLSGGDNNLIVYGTLYRGFASAINFDNGKITATVGKINNELNPLLKDSFPYTTQDTTQYGVFLVNKGTEEEPAFLKKEEYTYTVNPNGTATIKGVEAKTNGQTGYYGTKVRPYKPVERITISEQTVYLRVGENYTPTVTIEPQTYTPLGKDTVNPNVEWLSSDNQVATVNPKTGELTAQSVGSAAIVVQTIGITAAEEQESAIELYGIVVRAVVKEVEITPGKREITGKDTTKWEVNVTPDDADPEYETPYTTASPDLIAIEKHTPTNDYPFEWQVRVKKLVPNDTTIKITVQSKDAPEIKTDTELLLKYVRVDTVAIDTLSILTGDNQTFHWRTDQLQKGNYLLLSHTIKPDSAYYTTVSWQSLNEEVATVKDSLGKCKVTGLAPGETQIVVLTTDTSESVIKSSDTLTIHVYEVELTEIKIGEYAKDKNGTLQNIATSELQMGEEWELTVTPQPPFSIPAGDYTWESSDPTTAEVNVVDGKVIVTGINPGTVDIRVYYNPNFEISDTVTLTIYTTNVSGVKILSGQQTVLPVHGIKELSATVIPQTATHKEITWESSEDTIATVTDHGDGTAEVKALAPGTAYIYALSAEGNYKDSTKVTVVKVSVSKVTIDKRPKGDSLQLGTSFSYQCTVLPANASYPAVTWSSKNANIASVNADGTVTGISKGETVIYVTTLDGDKKDSVNLKIYPVKVSGVKINASSKTVAIGETLPLTAQISPDGVNESYTVTWESDNSAVAEVNNTGAVTGKTPGNALITVNVRSDNSEYTDTLTVTVYTVSVSGVMITGDKQITLPIGSSAQLTATVSPANASVKTLTWSSGDANIATVDNGGKVTALSWGDTYIYVFTLEGGYKDSVSVNVPPVAVNAIKISGGGQLTKGETMQLTATISPHNATNKSVTWSSENENIATVDQNGLVTGISVGQTTIYVTAVENGITDSAAITVTPIPVSGVTIAGDSEISLPIGATYHLSATVLPTNATNKSITWNTSNESVVAVSETGDLLAVTPGIAIITVTTTEGGYQSSVTITVHTVAVEGVTIQGLQTLSLPIGTEKQLTFTISPANATDQTVTWSSSDESVALVSETGMLTALSPGDASIYVTTTDGGLTDSVTVIVTPIPVNSVTIAGEASLSVPIGANHELTATISPANATDPTVTWSSSDETVALVSETGIITALSPGDATITVTTTDGGYKDSVWLTVTPTPIPVEGVKIEGAPDSLAVDSTVQLTVIVLPEDANVSYATSWESSDDSIASVNSDGIVTGRNEGKATLYVKVTTADSTYTDSVTINVYTGVALPQITALEIISDSSWLFIITRPAGDPQGTEYGTLQLSAAITYTPADATIDEVVSAIAWSSGDTTVATVNNKGLVTAVGDGITPITLTVTEKATGKEVSVSLNVTIITSGIEPNVSPSSVKVYMADNTLYVNSAVAEKVTIYTISGQMLYSVNKPAGEIPIQLKNTPEGVLLICGASGWRSLVF